jgi:hypothetical protein
MVSGAIGSALGFVLFKLLNAFFSSLTSNAPLDLFTEKIDSLLTKKFALLSNCGYN